MSKPNSIESANAEAMVEKTREILKAAVILRDEAAEARDRTEDVIQASYWSGRANALSEIIKRLQNAGV
jgi:hypothetical protein